MRNYNYKSKWQKLLTPEVVSLLTQIHEYKGEQNLFIEAKADTLTQLVEIAKIQSTEASNKIEGIYTSDERLKSLVSNKTTPRTRNEQEIAGYRDVLSTIHESHDFIPVKPSIMTILHNILFWNSLMTGSTRFISIRSKSQHITVTRAESTER